jgi:hypothetical protein
MAPEPEDPSPPPVAANAPGGSPDGESPAVPPPGVAAQPRRSKPWLQQKGERARAFAAARIYFELGADRSLTKVAQKSGKDRALIARWSERWRWVARARDYDKRMTRIAQQALEKAVAEEATLWVRRQAEIRDREWRCADLMQNLGEQALTDAVKFRDQTHYTVGEALSLLKRASELGRLAAGMPTRFLPPRGPTGGSKGPEAPAAGAGPGEGPGGSPDHNGGARLGTEHAGHVDPWNPVIDEHE